ncbi:ABC multidrug transporter [Apodospora peruviana]|uniref:ABC multidrug transporter n=1 Tax=Apodospora peruviana TaxID=516989 RepID=A0AAE0MG40_9PEZI|nr:ABC multidrug transporter [Apodospora peruviana]
MKCETDTGFGPVVETREGGDLVSSCDFDFTVTFESAFFGLAPSLLVLPFLGFRAWHVFKMSKVVDWFPALVVKLTLYLALGALHLAELGLYASDKAGYTSSELAIPSSVCIFVTIAGLAVLSLLEHSRTPRPASIIQAYLLFTLLFDIARLRTRWLIPGQQTIAALQAASFAMKSVLLVIESLPKTSHLIPSPDGGKTYYSPEETAGFLSRSLLLWLNPLFLLGYRKRLSVDDLYPVDDELGSQKLTEALDFAWSKTRLTRKRRLALALTRAFAGQLLLIQLPRMALVGFAVAQPFLVQAALGYIANHQTVPVAFGYGLIGAFGLVYTGISTLWYQHLTFRLLTMIRGSLIGMIFRHSLKLPASECAGSATAVSLMSTDMERIQQTLQWVLNVVPAIVQVGLGLWILSIYLGAVSVAPLVVGTNIPTRQRRWMQAIQKRVGITTDAIGYTKGVKMSGLSQRVANQIQNFRSAEMDDQKAFRRLQIVNITIGQTPMMITPAVTFAAFAMARHPVAELVSATTNMASALSCLDRVQEYLQKEVQQDSRALPPPITTAKTGQVKNKRSTVTGDELQSVGDMAIRQHQPSSPSARSPLVRIVEGSFGWEASKPPIIQGINIDVLPSTLTMVIGPVGVGKSTLLRSFLGETYILAGSVECASPKQIAYCDQEPWILNLSIRENILGILDYDEDRYRRVIEACQLQTDFAQLPKGDETLTGSKGLSLSGGQRQRIVSYKNTNRSNEIGMVGNEAHGDTAEIGGSDIAIVSKVVSHGKAQKEPEKLPLLQPRPVSSLRYYVSSMGKVFVWVFSALVLFRVGCNTAQRKHTSFSFLRIYNLTAVWLKFWVAANQRNLNEYVGTWVGIYMLFAILTVLFIALSASAPLSFFVAKDTGSIVNLFTGDLNLIDLALPVSFIITTGGLASLVGEIVLTCIASGYLAVSIPFLGAVLYTVQHIYLTTSRQLRTLDLELKGPLFGHFISTSAGLITIRAFSWTAAAEKENDTLLDISQRPHYLLFCLQRWLTLVLDLVTAGMAVLLMGLAVALRDSIDPGYLGVALVSVMNFGMVVSTLIIFWTNLETSLQAVGRIKDYVDTTPAEYTASGETQVPDAAWPSRGEVEISNISASYGELKVLDNVNLTFNAGTKVAICGRTGSGKSSLLALVLRLYEPDTNATTGSRGSITVDGVDILSLPPDRVRAGIVALPQDPLFLVGTVRENLDPLDEYTGAGNNDALWDVLAKTGLKELIEGKDGQLDAQLAVDWLSTGQRQLFCLARVMLRRNSRVLVLDEATSHLDLQTEKLVNELIKTEFKEWTVIVVTHRVRTVADADIGFDQVVVLRQGRVVEKGSPKSLLSKQGGSLFYEMVQMQDH